MLLPVSPGLNYWYFLAIISSLSWVLSSLAMDFIKKTTRPVSVFLIWTLVLSWFTSNSVLSKFYFSLQRNPDSDRFFHGYECAGKTIGYVLLLFGNVGLYYFSEKSVACMLTFLFLSFYCLCYLFCIQPYTDFGTLDFLLSATLNQTLNLFGLRSSSTWLVVVMVACIIGIAGLRYRLEPLHPPGERERIVRRHRSDLEAADSREYEDDSYLDSRNDLEAAGSREYEEGSSSGPFNIYRTKNASLDRLRRWRQAALVLNQSRRFRYAPDLQKELDLKKEKEKLDLKKEKEELDLKKKELNLKKEELNLKKEADQKKKKKKLEKEGRKKEEEKKKKKQNIRKIHENMAWTKKNFARCNQQ